MRNAQSGAALQEGGIQGISSPRPGSNSPPGRWPPAGVSNELQTLAGSHNIACKLHAITEDFQSSREAPKPHFPTFATLPSENLVFHQKSYFYLPRSGSPPPWIPPPWGLPKSWKTKEISLEGTLGVLSRPGSVAEGAQAALERPNLTEEDAQAAQKLTLEHSGSILELFGGGPKCSATRPCRCAEHFC